MEQKYDSRPYNSGEVEIDLLDLFKYLLRHILPILGAAILGAAVNFALTRYVITPVYEATSSIYVVSATANSALDLTELNIGTSLTSDYKKLVTSRTMLERVISDSGYRLTAEELKSMLTISNDAGTRILEFTITSPDPEEATVLANSMAEQACIFLPAVMGVKDNVPATVDPAVFPSEPSNIQILRNTLLGALAGILLASAVVAAVYILNDSFNSPEEVERYLGIVPMAVVPENGQKHSGGYYEKYGAKGDGKCQLPTT